MLTMLMPPTDCKAFTHKKNHGYSDQHTPGRMAFVYADLCNSGMDTPDTKQVAVLISSVIKVSYGSFLEYIAFCPCFVDYVGAFKVGALVHLRYTIRAPGVVCSRARTLAHAATLHMITKYSWHSMS